MLERILKPIFDDIDVYNLDCEIPGIVDEFNIYKNKIESLSK